MVKAINNLFINLKKKFCNDSSASVNIVNNREFRAKFNAVKKKTFRPRSKKMRANK